jgi:hypothetical protein
MILSTLIYVFALLSLGLLVATKAENQMQALQMSMAFILPSVFFSGFIFPRETMPAIFYALGAVLPTTYFIRSNACHHPARRNFSRVWAIVRHPDRHGGISLRRLRPAFPPENRVGSVRPNDSLRPKRRLESGLAEQPAGD